MADGEVGHPHRQRRRGWHGHRHRRDRGRGLDVRRLQPPAAAGDREAVQRLHRREPSVRRVRRVARRRRTTSASSGTAKDNWVETHPYMPGLLITYWDDSYEDNNVGEHPGHGLILPVDAHPQFSHWPDGTLMRNRILSYDSTFGLAPTAALALHLSRFDAEGKYVGDHDGHRPVPRRASAPSTTATPTGSPPTATPPGPTAPTRVATSPGGTASTSRRPARRSPSSASPSRATSSTSRSTDLTAD